MLRRSVVRYGRCRIITSAGDFTSGLEGRKCVGQAFAGEHRAGVADVEMEMRLGRVSRITEETEDLASADVVAQFHARRSGLHVRVKRVEAVANLNDYVISADGFQGDRGQFTRRVLGIPSFISVTTPSATEWISEP